MIGSFEVRYKNLLGRIGRIKTKSGILETPHLFPVINPQTQPVPLKLMRDKMGIEGVMTNAYLIKKSLQEGRSIPDIHELLDYDKIIATDSGAYQILVYGSIEIGPSDIIGFQEALNSDIAIILDVPTGYDDDHTKAKESVDITLERADQALTTISKPNILWMGPVQGGLHLDLLRLSAEKMASKPFPIYALGSPTQLMERYRFTDLVDMMMTVKKLLPLEKPIHLFGAGHPFMFSLAVACGFDTFDSASYAIYARNNRYITSQGTYKLTELRYLPCTCRVCEEYTAKELNSLSCKQKTLLLAEHNLWVCCEEIKRIKQAIIEGRLWELAALRSRSHPSIYEAFKRYAEHGEYIEKNSPIAKRRGVFYFSSIDMNRPEIIHYQKKLKERYIKPSSAEILVLAPCGDQRPYHKGLLQNRILSHLKEALRVHICFYTIPYSIIPLELDEMFPLSQTEVAKPADPLSIASSLEYIETYIRGMDYEGVLLIRDDDDIGWRPLERLLKAVCKSMNTKFKALRFKGREYGKLMQKVCEEVDDMVG